jgi:hemolysin type calcium-binding protein/calcineurin-like phosphoesterase family protein
MAHSGTFRMTPARMPRSPLRLRALFCALVALALVAVATAQAAAPLRGTAQDDRISGTPRTDHIRGGGGDDVLLGRAGSDVLIGGPGWDSAAGMAGNDVLIGDGGDDTLRGDAGRDHVYGGAGADLLDGGGSGPDLIRARDGVQDRITCGSGNDTVFVDALDIALGCELVRRPQPATPAASTPKASQPVHTPAATAPAAAVPSTPPAQDPPPQDPPADPPSDPPADPPADPPPPDDYPQLLAAGDIADCTPGAEQTAALLDQFPGTVTPLGDTAYPTGSYQDFENCYDPTWGRHKYRTRPAIGSHEYETAGALPYWDYFGEAAGDAGYGWYSYDLGDWHIVVLNSTCAQAGGCFEGSPQVEWLRDDLAAHPTQCTAAYWHTPRYSSGQKHGDDLNYVPIWQILYEHGVEFVMGGDDHHYERFAPQTPYGDLDVTDGIRQFVVGTGGRFLRPMTETPHVNSETRDNTTFGILRVELLEGAYDWEFVPVAGGTYTDSGSTACH